jgi:probable F420-dependent oxidoreductase
MRLGLTPPIEVVGIRAAVDLAVRAEALGYADVWTAEVAGADAFTPLAAIAERTTTIRLGTALAPVFTRPPALTAMTAAALQALSGGRFALGVGASSPAIVGDWMGVAFERPLTRVREYVEVLRDMLAGRKVSFQGETIHVSNFRLQVDPGAPVPIWLGALGPAMCRLAGRSADGVQFFLMTPGGVRQALTEVAAGAEEAGRDPAGIEVFVRLPVVLDEDETLVRFMGKRLLTGYATVPAYNASLRRQGFEAEAAAIALAWEADERDRATQLFSDPMFDAFFLHGSAEAASARLDEYRAAGVTTPTLMPLSFAGSTEERLERVTATIEALAPAARSVLG